MWENVWRPGGAGSGSGGGGISGRHRGTLWLEIPLDLSRVQLGTDPDLSREQPDTDPDLGSSSASNTASVATSQCLSWRTSP